MASTLCQNSWRLFVKKLKIYLVRIIRWCSNFASLWHKHLLRNYKINDISDFRCQHLQRQYEIPYRNINFSHLILRSSSFMLPLLLITVEVKNIICNSLITMFTTSWRNLIKIADDPNTKFWAFLQKAVSRVKHSDISLASFWKRFLHVKQFHVSKVF